VSKLSKNYETIQKQIQTCLIKSNRPLDSAKLLAVTKGRSVAEILELAELGQTEFGENYVQEWKKKKEEIKGERGNLNWHFTGRLQTNKVKELVGEITLFHSIDRLKLAKAMDEVAKKKNIHCHGLVEVSLAGEESKGGVPSEKLSEFLKDLNSLENLKITGLMLMPPFSENPEDSRPYFKQLREILFDLNQKSIYKTPLTELSMGMSQDYCVAIEEGATWVRIGRRMFFNMSS